MEHARKKRPQRVLLMSSVEIYGENVQDVYKRQDLNKE